MADESKTRLVPSPFDLDNLRISGDVNTVGAGKVLPRIPVRQLNKAQIYQRRFGRLIGFISAKKCGAQDAGDITEAEYQEGLLDAIIDACRYSKIQVKNNISAFFGAPADGVDLRWKLSKRYQNLLAVPSKLPPEVPIYCDARNMRIVKFNAWSAAYRSPEALVWAVVRFTSNDFDLDRAEKVKFASLMTARRKEIRTLHKAIDGCVISTSADTRLGGSLPPDLLFDPNFFPWGFDHAVLLRHFVSQDFETNRARHDALYNVIIRLRNGQAI